MEKLNLPAVKLQLKKNDGVTHVFDVFRQKYVLLTPEEWVRQHFAHFLVNERGYKSSLIGIEVSIKYNGQIKRADIVLYDKNANPFMVIECKASTVRITQAVFEQAGRYNSVFKAPILILTNGIEHFVSMIDFETGEIQFQEDIPVASK